MGLIRLNVYLYILRNGFVRDSGDQESVSFIESYKKISIKVEV